LAFAFIGQADEQAKFAESVPIRPQPLNRLHLEAGGACALQRRGGGLVATLAIGRWCPFGNIEADIDQLVGALRIGIKPIRDIAAQLQIGQQDNADGLGDAVQSLSGCQGFLGPSVVIVLQDDDVTVSECFDAVIRPFAGSYGCCAVL
jgi:hypothetical protein